MATDVADWTTAVNVTGGTVTISGIATVTISGTPSVNVANTPSVSISGTPIVNIGNTPSVTISGTPTVILGAGTASIGSISAIGSTVTVAGTINIGNTPSVTISGTPNVNISSGSVAISGTPNINIQSQSVNLNVQSPQTALADLVFPAGQSTQTTAAVPAGTHALMLINTGSFGTGDLLAMLVIGHTTLTIYEPADTSMGGSTLQGTGIVVVPVVSVTDTQFNVSGTNNSGANLTIKVIAILDTEAVWVQNTRLTPVFTRGISAPYDATGTNSPGAGTQATVTLAASPNNSWSCHTLSGSQNANAAAGGLTDVTLSDGATVKFKHMISTTAVVGSGAGVFLTGLAYKGTLNTAMTLACVGAIASNFQRVNIGAHLVGL